MPTSRNTRRPQGLDGPALAEYLLSRCKFNPETGCLEWQGSRARGEYGQVSYKGRMEMVTRLLWFLRTGEWPDELDILHSCDNPPCCNFEHHRLGTHIDNMNDRSMRGRTRVGDRRGEKHHLAKLTREQVVAIMAAPGLQRVIAAEYGVARSLVSRIKGGKRWAE